MGIGLLFDDDGKSVTDKLKNYVSVARQTWQLEKDKPIDPGLPS
jgi:hypothetical protein